MSLDSYATPGAESLLLAARQRFDEPTAQGRALITEWAAAIAFIAVATGLALVAHSHRSFSAGPLAAVGVAYLAAGRVRFAVGSAWTAPTQLVFVPMLFVLPMPWVPLVIAGLEVADLLPDVARRQAGMFRAATRVGSSFYSLGPVLVLVLSGHQAFSWGAAPWLVLALAAQLAVDGATGLARTWFADGVAPRAQPQMLWLYLTDACLSCAALAVAADVAREPALVLLALPLVALFSIFARERRERLDNTLALSSAYRGAAYLLGDVIDAVDHYTAVHTHQVVELSVSVSRQMGLGLTRERDVEFSALLHDVGKIRVPIEIINKPGKLTEREWERIRQHTIDGEAMLKQMGGTLADIGRFVRSSHERFDGRGYPDGLAGDEIPIESRIVAACDAYNAMTTDRPYRQGRATSEAVAELRRCAGTQFDSEVVESLERVLIGQTPVDDELLCAVP
jgi:HD-GYP domain-containing protein (c-di-GMP phosphodiesterase class II)